jgi:phosphatidate phosphatase APP1
VSDDLTDRLRAGLADLEARFDRGRRALKAKAGLRDPIRPVPYIGYGADGHLRLKGRVLEHEVGDDVDADRTVGERLLAMLRRYESDEVPGARVAATLGQRREVLESDEEGFFELRLEDAALASPWTQVQLELLEPLVDGQDNPRQTGLVRVPGPSARRAVISDLDDTVLETGATSFFEHARTVLLNDAKSREAFAGVAPFYRALADGPGGDEGNPFFYVSSSPWNLFDLFDSFLELHDIPRGPLFLKEYGLDDDKLFKRGHTEYKAERITTLAEAYPSLELVLIGDCGQKDAWVFEEVVDRLPGRVAAIYLRDLDEVERDEVKAIGARLDAGGVPCRRVKDFAEAAEHAAECGLVSSAQRDATIDEVARSAATVSAAG